MPPTAALHINTPMIHAVVFTFIGPPFILAC
jgi:hypothetical protein